MFWRVLVVAFLLSSSQTTATSRQIVDRIPAHIKNMAYSMQPNAQCLMLIDMTDENGDQTLKGIHESYLFQAIERRHREKLYEFRWLATGRPFTAIGLHAVGCKSLILDGIMPRHDYLVVVNVKMLSGDAEELISNEEAWRCCLDTSYVSLDEFFPKNTVDGYVRDQSTGQAIAGVDVYCEETGASTTSDDSGYYRIELSMLQQFTLHVWHSVYDSLRFESGKQYVRTNKRININYERRRDRHDRLRRSYKEALFAVGRTGWGGWMVRIDEDPTDVFTYLVEPWEEFGPAGRWPNATKPPFRLVAILDAGYAGIKFDDNLGVIPEQCVSYANTAILSHRKTTFNTKTLDAGVTFTVQLLSPYEGRR